MRDAMERKRRRRKKKGDFSKGIVILLLTVAFIFTTAILILFARTGAEPATLVTCFFAGVIAELWSLAGIKKKKIISDYDEKDEEARG